jgi:aldehyde:ferredoxin oxidoreductase
VEPSTRVRPSAEVRRLLVLDCAARTYRLRTLRVSDAPHDSREDRLLLWGEALCQALLQEDPHCLVMARGPLAFLPGNKATVGYISPLTEVPHYSFVGGRLFAELFGLGLDAIVLTGARTAERAGDGAPNACYAVLSGRAPELSVEWRSVEGLPTGQRSAHSWLLEHELGRESETGSILTLGEAAYHGYRSANLAVDGLYHAGRGGAGAVFVRFLRALVLRGRPLTPASYFGSRASDFAVFRDRELKPRLDKYCARFSRRDGGTVTKLYATGTGAQPTLPARNAQRLGYACSDLGARRVLKAQRAGQTGCHWCHVNCRHWHWVNVDYTPDGRDRYLDDFEPTYALFAMLDLLPDEDSLRGRLDLIRRVDESVMVPIEQMGIDVIDAGVAISALFEGLERGLIPLEDVPPTLRTGPYFGSVETASRVVMALRQGDQAPALQVLGDGPEGLAHRYPALRDVVFSSGAGTLANPGHGNALWTFLMPFSRFFGHYSGQIYKVPGELRPEMSASEVEVLFAEVVRRMLEREFFGCLGNALSNCAFTFVIFSEGGTGERLDSSGLLARTLAYYGLEVDELDLLWFAQAFWARSMALKVTYGWRPPTAATYPDRVYELLGQVLQRPAGVVRELMESLIVEWGRQAGEVLGRFGYQAPWS